MSARCHTCDRPDGWANDPHPGGDCPANDGPGLVCVPCESLCWDGPAGYQCQSAAVDWRARAIAAGVERDAALARLAELEAEES